MGKLNYTHRKIEGLKLGQVVAKDLSKRIPPSTGSKAALRDPMVELDISGKALTPEGFFELGPALMKSIEYECEQGQVVRLEELSLSDSKLDARCLRMLGRIVASASENLRDLDLSRNDIKITTDTEAAAWELFLSSFSNCCRLRKIDLSGNNLGYRAFEILTRVYSRETTVEVALLSDDIARSREAELGLLARKLSLASNPDGPADLVASESQMVGDSEGSRHESKYVERSDGRRQYAYPETRGLRSVPYVVLSDTSMTEICALHLSYIVASHNLPDLLLAHLPMVKPGASAQQLLAYDQDSGCRGVIYTPNPQLGPAGLKVLDLAEAMRDSLLDEGNQGEISERIFPEYKAGNNTRRASDVRGNPLTSDRRRSNSTPGGIDHVGNGSVSSIRAELDRARSRIQGNTIKEAGTRSNDLWRIALKLLILGRAISSGINDENISGTAKLSEVFRSAASSDSALRTSKHKPQSASPLAAKDSNRSITPNFGPWRLENSMLMPLTVIETLPKKLLSPPISPLTTKPQGIPYRSQLPCQFSEDIWRRIIATAAGADGVMSEAQQLSMLRWAWDRNTLGRESESLGLKDSAQIWKVLEATGCLAYEMNV